MSASEKLRALDGAMSGRTEVTLERQVFIAEYAKRQLVDALPLIAAVVEAAETVSAVEATGTLPDFQPLADALTALREHLEGGDE